MSKEDFPSGPSSKPLPPHLSSFHPADEPASPDWFNPIYDDAPAAAPVVASAQTKAPELSDEPEQQTNGIDKSIEARADKIASRVASEGGFGRTPAVQSELKRLFRWQPAEKHVLVDAINRNFQNNNKPYYMGTGGNDIILYAPEGITILNLRP